MTRLANQGLRGLVLVGLILGVAMRAAAGDGPATTTRATTGPAGTQPVVAAVTDEHERVPRGVWGDAAVARQMIDAGDGRVAGTLLAWLASEGEGVRSVGMGSGRLREAVRGAEALRLTEAVPALVALAESQRAFGMFRWDAALAAIRIDPGYSPDFLRAVMDWESRGAPGGFHPACAAAAGALVTAAGDEAARQFLLEGYRARLDAREAGRRFSDAYAREIARLADGTLRDRVRRLAGRYARAEVRAEVEAVAEQMRVNALGEDALLAAGADATAADPERRRAVVALRERGGPGVVERLSKLAAAGGDGGSGDAANDGDASLGAEVRRAVAELRRRHRLGRAAGIELPVTAGRVPNELPAGHEVWLLENVAAAIGGRPASLSLASLDGRYRVLRAAPAEDAVMADALRIGMWELVAVTFDPANANRVTSVAGYDARPGEAARDGYVLAERRAVTDGRTTRSAVVLAKLGRRVVARVPNRTGADGRVVPDSAVSRALERLSPGDAVEARLEETGGLTMLAWVGAYRPSLAARFVRRVDVRRGGGGGEVAPGVVLSVARRERTFVAPPPGPRRLALEVDRWAGLWPGVEVRVTPEEEGGGGGGKDGPVVLRDLRVDGMIGPALTGGNPGVGVQSGRASWYGSGLSWSGRSVEASRLDTALFHLRTPDVARRFAPDKVAALRAMKPAPVPTDGGRLSAELREKTAAWAREGDSRRREGLEQQMFLALQRYMAEVDAAADERCARVKELLGAEQYKALLEIGAAAPTTARSGAATRPASGPVQ